MLRAVAGPGDGAQRLPPAAAPIVSLAEQVDASRAAADLARIRYKEGSIDFLVLLDAERTLLAAEDALTAAQTDANTDIVAIYKALGGGWG